MWAVITINAMGAQTALVKEITDRGEEAVVSETSSKHKHTVERSFCISILAVGVDQFAKSIRSRWGIEDTCHRSLVVTLREDAFRTMER